MPATASPTRDVQTLWTLGYASVAARLPTDEQLNHILATARRDNPAFSVTGLLVHCGGTFMQVLEGPRAGVDEIFRRICTNPIHTGIQLLFEESTDEREFGDWAMLCRQVTPQNLEPVLSAAPGTRRNMVYSYWRAWQSGA